MAKNGQHTVLKKLFVLMLVFASPTSAQNSGADHVALREALDRRDAESTLLAKAVTSGDLEALRSWGLMGPEACKAIRPYLEGADAVKVEALAGLAYCGGEEARDQVFELAQSATTPAVQQAALEALGFIVPEGERQSHVDLVSAVLQSNASDEVKASAIYGLMQNITYAGLEPADFQWLDISYFLNAAQKPGRLGFEAAYFLIRLQRLASVLPPDAVKTALDADVPVGQAYLLARVAGQFRELAPALMAAAEGHKSDNMSDRRIAVSAVRALGSMADPQSRTYLLTLLLDAAPTFQHLALTALAARQDADAIVQQRIRDFVADENPWLAVTALRALVGMEDAGVGEVAARWLSDDDAYRAFVAQGLLSQSEEGRAVLNDYAAANANTPRGRAAARAADPASGPATEPRKTPNWSLVQSYRNRELVLETSRGTICIRPSQKAPYAAANFMLLADSGKLDNMLWHRVIPGFVAQAGQSEDESLQTWGSIREEWSNESHEPGTVGLATAGRDTGGTQFFINLEHNRHLDGRYTVFGRVSKGMDAAYEMQEGDVIERATTERAPSAACAAP